MLMVRTRTAGCPLTVNMYNRTIGHVLKWLYCRRHGALSVFIFYLYICCTTLLVSTLYTQISVVCFSGVLFSPLTRYWPVSSFSAAAEILMFLANLRVWLQHSTSLVTMTGYSEKEGGKVHGGAS